MTARVSELEDLARAKEEQWAGTQLELQQTRKQLDTCTRDLEDTQQQLAACTRDLEAQLKHSKLSKLEGQDELGQASKLWQKQIDECERSVTAAEQRVVETEADLRIQQVYRARAEQRLEAKTAEVEGLASEAHTIQAKLNLANAREAEHLVQKQDLEELCAAAHRAKRQAEHALLVSRNKLGDMPTYEQITPVLTPSNQYNSQNNWLGGGKPFMNDK